MGRGRRMPHEAAICPPTFPSHLFLLISPGSPAITAAQKIGARGARAEKALEAASRASPPPVKAGASQARHQLTNRSGRPTCPCHLWGRSSSTRQDRRGCCRIRPLHGLALPSSPLRTWRRPPGSPPSSSDIGPCRREGP